MTVPTPIGKECVARHERSNDWPQGGARGARSAPPNPDRAQDRNLYYASL